MNDEGRKAVKRPAFQFYPADWRKDLALRKCSLAARGMWVEIMCIAHECEPYGTLRHNGEPLQADDIAGLVGMCSPREAKALIDELVRKGVAKLDADGVIYSKRMVHDEAVRNARAEGGKAGAEHGAKGAEHGSKGGRPTASKGVFKGGSETPLQVESKPPPSSSSSSSASAGVSGAKAPSSAEPTLPGFGEGSEKAARPTIPCPYAAIVEAYHRELPTLPRVRLQDGPTWVARQKAMRSLWAWVLSSRKSDGSPRATTGDEGLAWLTGYFRRAAQNDFVMGRTARSAEHANWRADFDFLLSQKGLKQVIEKTQEAA